MKAYVFDWFPYFRRAVDMAVVDHNVVDRRVWAFGATTNKMADCRTAVACFATLQHPRNATLGNRRTVW